MDLVNGFGSRAVIRAASELRSGLPLGYGKVGESGGMSPSGCDALACRSL